MTQLHRCASWEAETAGWGRRGKNLQRSSLTECFLKDKNERKLQEQPKLFAKRTPLCNDGKVWNWAFPWAGSVTGLKNWTNNTAQVSVGSKLSACQSQDSSSPVLKTNQTEMKSAGYLRCNGKYMWLQLREGVISIYLWIPGCSFIGVPWILA